MDNVTEIRQGAATVEKMEGVEAPAEINTEVDADTCTVVMDGETFASKDFVAILNKPDGDASFLYNTDALSLGMAVKLVAKGFIDAMNQCTEEERSQIQEILGDAYPAEERADA